jgi:hypothetical protein
MVTDETILLRRPFVHRLNADFAAIFADVVALQQVAKISLKLGLSTI